MTDINFANIREHDGSKQKGFEELVCQIAHLEKPTSAKTFIRKEGDGGDSGVECFWIFDNDEEHAWQAKYFMNSFNRSQWRQINDSVESALNKHPKLTRYYICVPRDRTDSRKEMKGKKVKTVLDYWNEYVENWTALAKAKGMQVEFVYWGKHELIMYLQRDKPQYTGKILYWFNDAEICCKSLVELATYSRECLGERFTPEYHVDLPIASRLSCIGCDQEWKESIMNILSDIYDLSSEIKSIKNCILLKNKEEICSRLIEDYNVFVNDAFEFEKDDSILFKRLEIYKTDVIKLLELCNELREYLYKTYSSDKEVKDKFRDENYKVIKVIGDISALGEFFNNKDLESGRKGELLVTGAAGSGKSHLLCDIAQKRLEHNLPTVFLLGQHYKGGSPVKFIADSLNLPNHGNRAILGALDALGEAHRCRTLIIIDAINEGNHRTDWQDHLKLFLIECRAFTNIAVVISCRNTYKEYIIPDDVLKDIHQIIHEGFRGHERRASLIYLGKQGIALPSVPFLSPEFSNPLFLKITCNAIKAMGLKEFPKGLNGFNKVFEFYIEGLENIIMKRKQSHNKHLVHQAISALVNTIYPDYLWGIPCLEAEKIINNCDMSKNGSESLFDILILEGLLSLDVIKDETGKESEVVRFTYEHFNDYAVAKHILEDCNTLDDLKEMLKESGIVANLLTNENRYRHRGMIEALGIEIPEKFGIEFIELIQFDEEDDWEYNWFVNTTFKEGILSRTANSITDKSLELLNGLERYHYSKPMMDILVSLSTEPNHPWNADFLNSNLKRKPLAERDEFWSTYVAVNNNLEDDEQTESPIRTLLNWVLDGEIEETDPERLRLTGIILLWLTTTSNRLIRQQATKALAKVFYNISEQICDYIEQYNELDDAYLVTSLYGAAYGAVVNIKDANVVREVCESVIDKQFNNEVPHPHILVRDYAGGIIEYAFHLSPDSISDIEKYRPPYTSKWPLENPLPSEIDAIDEEYSKIKNSVQGFINDFGKYTMKDANCWTATPLSKGVAESGKSLQFQFAETLPEDLIERYKELLNQKVQDKSSHAFDIQKFLSDVAEEEIAEEEVDGQEKLKEELFDGIEDETLNDMSQMIKHKEEELINEIKSVLCEAEQEYFRWVRKQGVTDSPAQFSCRWACRWVIKRAYGLGWTKELFEDFERINCYSYYGHNKGVIERIGKKYQWIAYYELLARLADNLIFYDRGYSDVDDSKFYGPWQIDIREMDPTFWFRAKKELNYKDLNNRWWRPYVFNAKLSNLDEQINWLWDTNSLPNFESIISSVNINDREWITLFSHCSWDTKAIKEKSIMGEPNLWYRINTCVIKSEDLNKTKENLREKPLRSPDFIHIPNNNNQRFFAEYPWHPCYDDIKEWKEKDEWERDSFECNYHVPLYEYEWSTSEFSYMLDETTSFYMPSKKLIREMRLTQSIENPLIWFDEKQEEVFMDPGFNIDTQPCALINKQVFQKWLNDNGLVLLWIIGGEKQLFTHSVQKFYGRLVYSALYSMDGTGEIEGEKWSEKELPYE